MPTKNEPPNEAEVKRAAEIREWLEARILDLETELNTLKDMQLIVDSVLRKTSFIPATELRTPQVPSTSAKQPRPEKAEMTKSQLQPPPVAGSPEEPRQLRRSKDGILIASAFVSPDKVLVIPSSEVKLQQTIPPFQNFFVNRILKGYESKDLELVAAGKLSQSEVLTYIVEEAEGNISKISVSNYRDKSRLNEILSTVNWAFTRMLEKK